MMPRSSATVAAAGAKRDGSWALHGPYSSTRAFCLRGQDAKNRFHLTLTRSISSVVCHAPITRGDDKGESIVSSFSQQHIAHFQAFGFVAVQGLLDDAETAALSGEVTAALGDAFGGIGTDT